MADPAYIYDAALSFEGGVDSGVSPQLLAKNQLAWAVNCTVRGDFITNRPSYRKINLTGTPIPTGLFQEAGYYQPDASPESLFAAIGGQFIQFIPDTLGNATVSDLTPLDGGQSNGALQNWMWQAENFLIWQDGISLPLIFDGNTIRRSLGIGTLSGGLSVYATIPATPPVVAPAIGQSIIIPLGGPPNSTFAQTVQLNGALYSVQAYNPQTSISPSTFQATDLLDIDALVPGFTDHPAGTQVMVIPLRLGATSQSFLGLENKLIGATTKTPILVGQGTLTVDYAAAFFVSQKVLVLQRQGTGNYIPLTVSKVLTNPDGSGIITLQASESIFLKYGNLHPGPSFILNGNPSGPAVILGTLADDLTVPGTGKSVSFQINNFSAGSIKRDVWIGNGHYLVTTFPGSAVNTIVLTNIDDQSGNPSRSITTTAAAIVLPTAAGQLATSGSSTLIPFTDTTGLITGQQLVIADGTHTGTFTLSFISGNNVKLTWVNAAGDSAASATISTGGIVSYTGVLNGQDIYSLPEIPAGRMGTYGMGRVWQSGIDGISYSGGDIVGYSSGTAAYNYRDAVLKMTANQTLLSGNFRVPGGSGQITGMTFPAQLDTSLGQGALQVFTQRAIFSCNAPIDSNLWQKTTNPLQTESLKGSGAASHWSIALANADVFFRSFDGQSRSLLLARLDFNRWGDTPIGFEMARLFEGENENLLNFISAVTFDNRKLETATPMQGNLGVYHPDIFVLNFDTISTIAAKSPSVYDGVWQGLNVLKLVTGFFSGVQRTFAFCQGDTGIELWEILTSAVSSGFDNIADRIQMQFELPCFFNNQKIKGPFDLCRLWDGEIYADSIQGDVDFLIEYRPDFDQTWHTWASWTVKAGDVPTYQTRMGLGQPPLDDNNAMKRPSRDAYFFQLRVTITGPCKVRGIRLKAALLPQPDFAPMIDGARTLEPQLPVEVVEQFVLVQAPPASTGNQIYSGCGDPNGVVTGNIGDEYNEICGGIFIDEWVKVADDGLATGWV